MSKPDTTQNVSEALSHFHSTSILTASIKEIDSSSTDGVAMLYSILNSLQTWQTQSLRDFQDAAHM